MAVAIEISGKVEFAKTATRPKENEMDASHPVRSEHELSTVPVAFGVEGAAAPGAVDNSALVVG